MQQLNKDADFCEGLSVLDIKLTIICLLIVVTHLIMSIHSSIVCGHALDLIVQRGSRQVRDNRTVRKHIQNFVASQSAFISDDMLAQAGATVSNPVATTQNQEHPLSIPKDHCSYRSIKSTSRKPSGTEVQLS